MMIKPDGLEFDGGVNLTRKVVVGKHPGLERA
jgi:hypothetical protein